MKLSNIYDITSVDEAIRIAESHRSQTDYLVGKSGKVARTNIWTAVKWYLEKIKKKLESEAIND